MEELKEETITLWEMGFCDTDILDELRHFYDTNRYGLAYRHPSPCASCTHLTVLGLKNFANCVDHGDFQAGDHEH